MKACHAVALALVGWYLMMPPVVPAGNGWLTWDADAPLSQWKTIGSFDTAIQCQADLRARREAARTRTGKAGNGLRKFAGTLRCVGSDDPRLKGN